MRLLDLRKIKEARMAHTCFVVLGCERSLHGQFSRALSILCKLKGFCDWDLAFAEAARRFMSALQYRIYSGSDLAFAEAARRLRLLCNKDSVTNLAFAEAARRLMSALQYRIYSGLDLAFAEAARRLQVCRV